MSPRVWFITGASRGLGAEFARAALAAGNAVAATARDLDSLAALGAVEGERLFTLEVDVTDRASVYAAVERALSHFGHIDVAVNNAGYGFHGAVEELRVEELRAQLETNLFGALSVIQAVMPGMRRQRSGHIINISSTAGGVGFPLVGAYCASKFALEGLSECLALEAAGFGIKVTIVEPSDFRTGFMGACVKRAAPIPEYAQTFADLLARMAPENAGNEAGDAERAAAALLALVEDPDPPLRLVLGNRAFDRLTEHHRLQIEEWAAQEEAARAADY